MEAGLGYAQSTQRSRASRLKVFTNFLVADNWVKPYDVIDVVSSFAQYLERTGIPSAQAFRNFYTVIHDYLVSGVDMYKVRNVDGSRDWELARRTFFRIAKRADAAPKKAEPFFKEKVDLLESGDVFAINFMINSGLRTDSLLSVAAEDVSFGTDKVVVSFFILVSLSLKNFNSCLY